ncbi:MAG TPA: prenyltransferase/squalene oxidase repeat-containing protein [Planctomycetaceae bacterium]|nr:prenyltransferase/squalene oxidase repeat-containing protein [Planctomycetaceae bacterium]
MSSLTALSGAALAANRFAFAADEFGPDPKLLKSLREKAVNFLKTTQSDDGSWTSKTQPGITAMVCFGLESAGVKGDDATLQKGLQHLLSYLQKDGGIYHPETNHKNYETSLTLLALAGANSDGKLTGTIKDAEKFLRALQWDETEGLDKSHPSFGGAGYGKSQRPDLSNTTFLLDALKAAGAKADDPAMQNALVFVSRCQNLESDFNTTEFAAKVNDGGFYYTPAAGGNSQAGKNADGGLRSYASMTYAGLKSMLYAGLGKDDKRVKAALDWIRKFYSVDQNPGLDQQGLYYYYHTFAKTLATLQVDLFEDAKGQKHDWRKELTDALAKRQKENGSWVNSADRWMEGDPNLATAYSLMALKFCEPK